MSADQPAEQPTKVHEAAPAVADAEDVPAGKLSIGRRWSVRILLTLAVVLGVVAMLAVWVNRQALNADNWATTSSSLLENKEIRGQVSNYLVDQVYANVNVKGQLEEVLPTKLQPLAGPATGALRNLADQSVELLLSRPVVQEAWKEANRLTMRQLVNIVDEKQTGLVTAKDGAVIINLQPLVKSAVTTLGLPTNLTDQIPPDAGSIKVLSNEQVRDVQSYAKLLRGLALVLPIVVFLLFVLALLAAKGRRRRTLIYIGVDLIIIGVLVLVVRVVGGHAVVDQLATTEAVRPATQAVWDIATNMLRDIAWGAIITAIPIIAAAVLAGPTQPAVATRRLLAPWMRDQRGVTYGVVGVLLLILILWAPLTWMQSPIPVLLMVLLVVVGVELLCRQSIREFPDAQLPNAGEVLSRWGTSARRTMEKGGTAVSDAVSSVRDRHSDAGSARASAAEAPTVVVAPKADVAPEPAAPVAPVAAVAPAAPAPTPAPAASEDDVLGQLERLVALQQSGLLTKAEVAAQKRRILGG
jgi:hypothetical protein